MLQKWRGLLFNWNLLGDGIHTVRALADGEAFGRATFTVTTLGVEFLQGTQGETLVADFQHRLDSTRSQHEEIDRKIQAIRVQLDSFRERLAGMP